MSARAVSAVAGGRVGGVAARTRSPLRAAESVQQVVERLDFDWSVQKKRAYAESFRRLMEVDLETDKMTVFEAGLQDRVAETSGAKIAQAWTVPSQVVLAEAPHGALPRGGRRVAYQAGGLAALLKAFELLHNEPSAHVVFATDGQLSIMDRSGLQGHEHPTQYDEYTLMDLFQAVADNVMDSREPEASDYRSFTVPLRFDMATVRALPAYIRFFCEFLRQKAISGRDVTALSKGVVQKQKHSLANYSRIDAMTRRAVGKPIMHRHGRLYFAFGADVGKLQKGLDTWNKLGIEAYMVDRDFLARHTLFDLENEEVAAYYIPNDSYFAPDIVETLAQYLEATYPARFTFQRQTRLAEILLSPTTGDAVAVRERVGPAGEERLTKVSSVYASLGHDQVFDRRGAGAGAGDAHTETDTHSRTRARKQVYKEILATSSTGDWVQTISKAELEARVPRGMDIEAFLDPANLLPCADKYNLHVTPLSYEDAGDAYNLYYRVTEGGVVSYEAASAQAKGSAVTERRDLVNTLYKLNRSQVGTWRPLCIGSCSRKIDSTNNRKEICAAGNVEFSFNASGTGVVDAAGKINLRNL
eukprot:TRINITY_DN43_c1_g1_i1.p1 TRINITY_DN43_c1_g1~~TRINITY_DN43_c1_g1_i1.p1  ORF type:complete len:586 (+),score=261.78 TRINITY_DN43_c1_g1_i1:158-1915(+)